MREAIKSAFRFASAPAWNGYVISPFGLQFNSTDDEIDEWIRANGGTVYHPVGSASMSPKGASWGVVDPDLSVKGLSGLRVVDLSIVVSHLRGRRLRCPDKTYQAFYSRRPYSSCRLYHWREGLGFNQAGLG